MRLGAVLLVGVIALSVVCTNADEYFFARLRKKYHRVRKLVHHAFENLGHNPNATILEKLHENYPQIRKLLRSRLAKLEQCYESSLGGKKMSIFDYSIGKIVRKFIVSCFCVNRFTLC